MDNEFVVNPVRIGFVRPPASGRGGARVQTFVLAGAAPPAVMRALAKHGAGRANKSDSKILRGFYGARWRHKVGALPAEDFMLSRRSDGLDGDLAEIDADGGADPDDEFSFDEEEIEESRRAPVEDEVLTAAPQIKSTYEAVPFAAFVDDMLEDLRAKIFAATRVPPFRQCVVWRIGAGFAAMHRVSSDGDLVEVDPRVFVSQSEQMLLGLPVDERLLRGATAVEPLDLVQRVSDLPRVAGGGPVVWLLDADDWIGARRAQIAAGTAADTIRRGVAEKFWPALVLAWSDYLRDPSAIGALYPRLSPGLAEVRRRVDAEQTAMNCEITSIGEALAREKRRRKLAISVRAALLTADSGARACDLISLFNSVVLGPALPAIRLQASRGERVRVAKVFGTPELRIMWPAALTSDDCPSVVLACRVGAQGTSPTSQEEGPRRTHATLEQEQSRFVFVRVDAEGSIVLRATFPEDREQSLAALGRFAGRNIGAAVKALHAAEAAFTPAAPRIADAFRYVRSAGRKGIALALETQSISVRMRWIAPISERAFAEFRRRVGVLSAAGIVRLRTASGRAVRADYVFDYVKGALLQPSRRICARRAAGSDAEARIQNGYVYLTDADVAAATELARDSVRISVSNRLSDLALSVSEVPQEMFLSAYSSLLTLLWGMQRDKMFETLPASEVGRHRLRRLQAVDPNLFNLKRYGADVVYSRLCQTQYQPLAFTEDEARRLDAKSRQRLTKLRNFTTGESSFYSCPDPALGNLAFITGKHPLGYCLPCCAKSMPVKGSPRDASFARCRASGLDERPPPADRRHVMTFGRELEVGRVAAPPAAIAELLYDAADAGDSGAVGFYVAGVEQGIFGQSRGGLWSSLAFLADLSLEEATAKAAAFVAREKSFVNTVLGGAFASVFAATGDPAAALRQALESAGRNGAAEHGSAARFAAAEFGAMRRGRAWDYTALDFALPVFGFHLLLFEPARSRGRIIYTARCSADTLAALESGEVRQPIAAAVMHPDGVSFPLALADPAQAPATIARRFRPGSNVATLLRNIFVARKALQEARSAIGPRALEEFAGGGKWEVVRWWRCKRGLLYAATLTKGGKTFAHVSFAATGFAGDAKNIRTAPFLRRGWKLPAGTLAEFIKDFNTFASRRQRIEVPGGEPRMARPFAEVRPDMRVHGGGDAVVAVADSAARAVFWIDDTPAATISDKFGRLRRRDLGASPDAVAAPGTPRPGARDVHADAAVSRYRSLLFGYIVDAVAREIAGARNAAARRQLTRAVNSSSVSSVASAVAARTARISESDVGRIRALARAHGQSPRWRQKLLESAEKIQFDFDRADILELGGRALLQRVARRDPDVVERVRSLAPGRPSVLAVPDQVSCDAASDKNICRGGKIAVPPDLFPHLAEIIDDFLSRGGWKLSMLLDGVPPRPPAGVDLSREAQPAFALPVSGLRFVTRPGEFIRWG